MSKLEQMRAAIKANQDAAPKAEVKADQAPRLATSAKLSGLKVKHCCGHELPIQHYTGVACPECRNKAREAQAKAKKEKFQKRREELAANDQTTRLPDGAVFNVQYDAAAVRWSGTLTIGDRQFTATESAVFKLLINLDRQFRATAVESQQGEN